MFHYLERVPIKVMSDRGVLPIEQCVEGDHVYEFNTGKLLEVRGIKNLEVDDVFEITFSDHRKSYSNYTDFIYLGDYVTAIQYFLKDKLSYDVKVDKEIVYGHLLQFPIEYEKNKIQNPLLPDPYVAGALLIYGDYNSKEMNLPTTMDISRELLFKYHLEYGSPVNSKNIGFIYQGDTSEKNITWEEFFPTSKCYVKSHNENDPIIPNEYLFGTINNREQFIRGIFDMGYYKNEYKDFAGIAHSEEGRLLEVQKILWSLGVLSEVVYNPNYEITGKSYHLRVIGFCNNYPGLFYNINNIEKMIEDNNKTDFFKLELDYVRWVGIGYMTNLILERKNQVYLTDNFLPRISL